MRSYAVFYIIFSFLVIGTLKLASYMSLEEKRANLAKVDFHKEISHLLRSHNNIPSIETDQKNLVILHWYKTPEGSQKEFNAIDKMVKQYKDNTAIYMISRSNEKFVKASMAELNIQPLINVLSHQIQLSNLLYSISEYFYDEKSLDQLKDRKFIAIVVDSNGRIKLYKIGKQDNLVEQIKNVLNY